MAILDTNNNLTTLTQVKSYLGVTGSTHDNALTRLLNAVSWRFNSETHRKLKARSHTTYLDGNGENNIYIDQYPINSNTTNIDIRVDPDRQYDTGDKIGSTSIIIYGSEGKIALDDDTFDKGEKSVKIIYNGGYTISTSSNSTSSTGTMPADLEYATCEMIRLLWNRETGNRVDIRSESVEGGSVTYETDMPWSVKKVLDLYRDRRFF